MVTGKIKTWNDDRGFGFIVPDEAGADVFAHISNVADDIEPVRGLAVAYDVVTDRRTDKLRANNVRAVQ